jgi:hypothetical protein
MELGLEYKAEGVMRGRRSNFVSPIIASTVPAA